LKKIRVLVYNGQYDVVVNTPGVLQFLNSLTWDKINTWKNAPKKLFEIDG
jgi:carboxypeptidase C (cathepsin A)